MNTTKTEDELKVKPTVRIKDAVIINQRLHGIAIDHPDTQLNGLPVITSTIVEFIPNLYHPDDPMSKANEVVETRYMKS